MDDSEKEKKLLASLDAMGWDEWLTLVKWFVAKLCDENPKLLAEIIIRRGAIRAEKMKHLDPHGKLENMAFVFGEVGVKLTV